MIVPADIFDPESMFVRLDMGELKISSKLQNYKKGFNYKAVTNEEEVYDDYCLLFTGLNLTMRDPKIETKQKRIEPLLENVSIHMTLSPCLEPLHPIFKSFKVSLYFVDALRLTSNWSTVELLLRLKSSLMV